MLSVSADSWVIDYTAIEFSCSSVLKAFRCSVTKRVSVVPELSLRAVTSISTMRYHVEIKISSKYVPQYIDTGLF